MMSSSVVCGDQYLEGVHDIMMVLGLRSEDGDETGAVINSYEGLGITTDRWCGEEVIGW